MKYALEERIGKPELFVGRKKELNYFLNWIDGIKDKKSMSTAVLARRKMGKTALMERLFNITFYNNDKVIPFYYEIRENKMLVVDFCKDFFLTFIYQYIAFKSRKPEYITPENISNFDEAIQIATKEGLEYLCPTIKSAAHAVKHEEIGILWKIARETPKDLAARRDEFIVQMIDEFQFLNSMIYRDKEMKNVADDLVGGYLSAAESKIAPLLVSGSWVGWLTNLLMMMLPGRFRYTSLENMPEDESIEMVYKYSQHFDVPVTEETAYLTVRISEGSPFYISSILRSQYENKDLTSISGLLKTLEFETLDNRGNIKFTWMEYVASAISRINDVNGKSIVLYLCKNRDREVTRKELLEKLPLNMTDSELELKLKALVKADIIVQGKTNFRYQGVRDNIFDKVFRGVYQEEIDNFDPEQIIGEYHEKFLNLKEEYDKLLGKFNCMKGLYAEYSIHDRLRLHAYKNNEYFKSITRYLPAGFNFCPYSSVWKYNYSRVYSGDFNIDIFARAAKQDDYSIIGEVKNRDNKKLTLEEAENFLPKFEEIKRVENLDLCVGFIFSLCGFTEEAEVFCKERGIAISEDSGWLGK